VTRISSSEQLNVVPDMAHCHISVRAFDEEGLDQAAAALEAIRAGCSPWHARVGERLIKQTRA